MSPARRAAAAGSGLEQPGGAHEFEIGSGVGGQSKLPFNTGDVNAVAYHSLQASYRLCHGAWRQRRTPR